MILGFETLPLQWCRLAVGGIGRGWGHRWDRGTGAGEYSRGDLTTISPTMISDKPLMFVCSFFFMFLLVSCFSCQRDEINIFVCFEIQVAFSFKL